MGLVALAFFLSARQSQSGLGGFGGGTGTPGAVTGGEVPLEPEAALTGFGLFAYNLLNVPFLLTGALGNMIPGKPGEYVYSIEPLGTVKFTVK